MLAASSASPRTILPGGYSTGLGRSGASRCADRAGATARLVPGDRGGGQRGKRSGEGPTCHPVLESAGGDVGEGKQDGDQGQPGQHGRLRVRWHAGDHETEATALIGP